MKNSVSIIWTVFLLAILLSLSIWAVFFIDELQSKISIFGIVGVITAAFTSVLTVTINNRKAKEREYELIVLKEKQKVFEHFYNAYFDTLNNVKKNKAGLSQKVTTEMMEFKRGLMNWGSERIIRSYFKYEDEITNKHESGDTKAVLRAGDSFIKEIRREMNFEVSKDINILSLILNPEARKELDIK